MKKIKTTHSEFGGDKKVGGSILTAVEKKFIKWVIPKLPNWLHTVHLTLATIPISVALIYFGYLCQKNMAWIWGISVCIFLQWLTDSLDGSLGKYRNTGLIKWGFYMDHFLDYFFLCSLVAAGYFLSPAGVEIWFFVIGFILSGFMINSFLAFSATNKFEIYHAGFGPTEFRLLMIGINTFIYYFGTTYFTWLMPVLCLLCFIVLAVYTLKIQKQLWDIDMTQKQKN